MAWRFNPFTRKLEYPQQDVEPQDSPTHATVKLTNLTDGKIPYHVDDATGLADGPTKTDVDSAVSLKHSNASDHTQGTDTALGAVGTKNPPIDADLALYRDSTASDALVTSTWTQVKAFLKTYFDTLYNLYVHPNHSGDVTSLADGATTIASKAVDIAMLADGTDGQLITWGADGVAATVATGNATQVLTSNGAGAAPTFQDAAEGGGTDNVARDNIVLLAWKLAIAEGLSIFNLEDGVVDEFEDETGVDVASCVAQSYNSTDDYYSPGGNGTGGTITTSGGNTIHTFNSSGTFVAPPLSEVKVLVVAGGGGGGGYYGGGGGAGGLVYNAAFGITPSESISITVGTGGAGSTGSGNKGTSGNNSVFKTITAVGGGGGGVANNAGLAGGSGGGGGYATSSASAGGDADYLSPRQGYDGGSHAANAGIGAGGGGGASAVGVNGSSGASGAGGAGAANSITGSSVTYAGGGGGGADAGWDTPAGGAGGGGAGGVNANGTSGTDNLGGGGGGGGGNKVGGDGGDGVVIISYPTQSGDMTLVSKSKEAEVEPTTARFIALVEPVDAITINTDLKGYISNDNGSNYDQVTLVDEGDFDASKTIFSANVTLTDRDDKTMVQKITTHNTKNVKIHAWGMLWK